MMRRRPESTAHLAAVDTIERGGHGKAWTAPAGAMVTSVDPLVIGNPPPGAQPSGLRSLTAAAQVLSGLLDAGSSVRIPAEQWQKEVWDLRREVGELRFLGDRQAASVSQCRLFIGRKATPDSAPAPVDDGPIAAISADMFGDAAANQQALRRAAQHLVYSGETELVVTERSGDRSWFPWSNQEVTGSGQMGWKINDGLETRDLGEDDLLVRCWTTDPSVMQHADGPTRSLLPVIRELVGLTKYVGAQIDSRLAGAGLLLVPEGIKPMAGQGFDDEVSFAQALLTSMVTPITNRDSAASVVPIVAEVDPSMVDKVKHLTFDSVLDPKAHELRDEAIRRVGLGMDSDPSVLLGQGGANHWSAWLISDQEVQMVVAPLAATICHALTSGWLRPYLTAAGIANANEYQVWFDTTQLDIRPDRSKDAQTLFDKGAIGVDSLRRENGFSDDDAPDASEEREALLVSLLKGAPSLAPLLLPMLGFDVPNQVLNDAQKITQATDGADPDSDTSVDDATPAPGADAHAIPDTLDGGPTQ